MLLHCIITSPSNFTSNNPDKKPILTEDSSLAAGARTLRTVAMLHLLALICALLPHSRGNDYYGEYVGDFKNRFTIMTLMMGSDKSFQIQYLVYSLSGSMGS